MSCTTTTTTTTTKTKMTTRIPSSSSSSAAADHCISPPPTTAATSFRHHHHHRQQTHCSSAVRMAVSAMRHLQQQTTTMSVEASHNRKSNSCNGDDDTLNNKKEIQQRQKGTTTHNSCVSSPHRSSFTINMNGSSPVVVHSPSRCHSARKKTNNNRNDYSIRCSSSSKESTLSSVSMSLAADFNAISKQQQQQPTTTNSQTTKSSNAAKTKSKPTTPTRPKTKYTMPVLSVPTTTTATCRPSSSHTVSTYASAMSSSSSFSSSSLTAATAVGATRTQRSSFTILMNRSVPVVLTDPEEQEVSHLQRSGALQDVVGSQSVLSQELFGPFSTMVPPAPSSFPLAHDEDEDDKVIPAPQEDEEGCIPSKNAPPTTTTLSAITTETLTKFDKRCSRLDKSNQNDCQNIEGASSMGLAVVKAKEEDDTMEDSTENQQHIIEDTVQEKREESDRYDDIPQQHGKSASGEKKQNDDENKGDEDEEDEEDREPESQLTSISFLSGYSASSFQLPQSQEFNLSLSQQSQEFPLSEQSQEFPLPLSPGAIDQLWSEHSNNNHIASSSSSGGDATAAVVSSSINDKDNNETIIVPQPPPWNNHKKDTTKYGSNLCSLLDAAEIIQVMSPLAKLNKQNQSYTTDADACLEYSVQSSSASGASQQKSKLPLERNGNDCPTIQSCNSNSTDSKKRVNSKVLSSVSGQNVYGSNNSTQRKRPRLESLCQAAEDGSKMNDTVASVSIRLKNGTSLTSYTFQSKANKGKPPHTTQSVPIAVSKSVVPLVTKAAPPTVSKRQRVVPGQQKVAQEAADLALKVIQDPALAKVLLLSMAMHQHAVPEEKGAGLNGGHHSGKDSPKSGSKQPHVIPKAFFWSNYEPLERILKQNMPKYYELSTKECQSGTQQKFNNDLVTMIMKEAGEHNWLFDEEEFDHKRLRDRVRCYYKTHIQNARKRLQTMLKNPTKRSNARHLMEHYNLVIGVAKAANEVDEE